MHLIRATTTNGNLPVLLSVWIIKKGNYPMKTVFRGSQAVKAAVYNRLYKPVSSRKSVVIRNGNCTIRDYCRIVRPQHQTSVLIN
ncbi:MAG: hypothetical protein CMI67_17800 [Pelagibaca sp.]|nr:hypothetical protein [Pelagibaca sp.]